MEKKQKDYVARISSATPVDLSIITSEYCIDNLELAIDMIDAEDFDNKQYHNYINKAKEIVVSKMKALDTTQKLGEDLLAVFLYINKLIVDGQFVKDKEKLLDAKKLLESQIEIFKVAKDNNVDGEKVIETSEKIIAGLTYSKGQLDEFVDPSDSRTFKA